MGFISIERRDAAPVSYGEGKMRFSFRNADSDESIFNSAGYNPYRQFLENLEGSGIKGIQSKLSIPALWLALVIESDRFAGIPLRIMKEDANGELKQEHGHPIAELFNKQPNTLQDVSQFRHSMATQRRLRGNHYSYINRVSGRVQELNPLDPDRMEVLLTENRLSQIIPRDGVEPEIGDYIYHEKPLDDGTLGGTALANDNPNRTNIRVFKRDDIFHIMWLTYDGYQGYGLDIFNDRIKAMMMANNYGMTWYRNSGAPSIIVTVTSMSALTEDDVSKIKQQIAGAANATNAGGVVVTTDDVKVEQLSVDPEKSQFHETLEFNVLEAARITGTPASMLFDPSNRTYNSVGQEAAAYRNNVLIPLCNVIEAQINQKLLEPGYVARFAIDSIQEGARQEQVDSLISQKEKGIITANEARAELGRGEHEDGDKLEVTVSAANRGSSDTEQQSQRVRR